MLTPEQQIFEQIKKANHILITFTKTWDGDAVASALAMYLFLRKLDKKVDIVAEKFDQGSVYSFLPDYSKVQHQLDNLRKFIISLDISNAKVGQVKYTIEENTLNFIVSPKDGFFNQNDITSRSDSFKYDLILIIDTPDLESLGRIYDNDTEFFYQIPIINIDHHSSNEEFGQINYIELTAVATAEIIFSLLSGYSRDLIDEDIATCLLTGMISKTRSFKTQNITPHALSSASQLISIGARREEIVNYLYRSRSLNVLKLWGRVLARLTSSLENKLVWSSLTSLDFTKTQTTENDLGEVIDELIINIPDAKVIIIIYEMGYLKQGAEESQPQQSSEQPTTKALIYSTKNIDSLNLTKEWNPLGTKSLAKIELAKPIQQAEPELIQSIQEKLSKLPV